MNEVKIKKNFVKFFFFLTSFFSGDSFDLNFGADCQIFIRQKLPNSNLHPVDQCSVLVRCSLADRCQTIESSISRTCHLEWCFQITLENCEVKNVKVIYCYCKIFKLKLFSKIFIKILLKSCKIYFQLFVMYLYFKKNENYIIFSLFLKKLYLRFFFLPTKIPTYCITLSIVISSGFSRVGWRGTFSW